MNYWFFFSYAHADQDNFLKTFYRDLAKDVRVLTGASEPESGFIDREGIEHGAQWDTTLEKALKSCRVFVPIYSSSYFLPGYCEKEFAVFHERVRSKMQNSGEGEENPLILPVLWNPENNVLAKLPESIRKIQYKHGSYPDEYLSEGLLQLVRLGISSNSKYYNQYWDFVRKFARTIQNAAEKYPLPPASTLTPLDSVQSIFRSAASTPATPSGVAETGPRYVQFIFVAGKQNELKAARAELKFYGQKGGSDWLPYLDSYKGNASALAIEAVKEVSKDLNYEEITLSTDIDKQIKEAASQDKIVVVMVDTWTLRLESYNQLVAPLDQHSSINCITLILWNDDDPEAAVYKTTLETAVNGTFNTKIAQTEPNFFHTTIKSYDSFKRELVRALARAQAQIIDTTKKKKNLGFALVKSSPGSEFETKPSL